MADWATAETPTNNKTVSKRLFINFSPLAETPYRTFLLPDVLKDRSGPAYFFQFKDNPVFAMSSNIISASMETLRPLRHSGPPLRQQGFFVRFSRGKAPSLEGEKPK